MMQLRARAATEWIRFSGTGMGIGFPANRPRALTQIKAAGGWAGHVANPDGVVCLFPNEEPPSKFSDGPG